MKTIIIYILGAWALAMTAKVIFIAISPSNKSNIEKEYTYDIFVNFELSSFKIECDSFLMDKNDECIFWRDGQKNKVKTQGHITVQSN